MKPSASELALRELREAGYERRRRGPQSDEADVSLGASRAKFVRKYRENPAPWPDGIGAWYRPEDWAVGPDGEADILIATGEARARALDPWANVRAKGEPCPPLPVVEDRNASAAPVTPVTPKSAPVTPPELGERNANAARQARWREAQRVKKEAERKANGG